MAPTLPRYFRYMAALTVLLMGACMNSTGVMEATFTLQVAAERAPCSRGAAGDSECIQVREREDDPWTLFYDPIEGFEYEPGFLYTIRVASRTVANPPADGSSVAYRLIELLSKEAVSPAAG